MTTIDMKKEAIAQVAQSIGVLPNDGKRSAMAETIVQYAEPNRLTFEVFRQFMNVATLKTGDNIMKQVRKGRYPVRSMVPGTSHLADVTYFQDKTAWMFDRLIAGAKANLWDLRSGDLPTVEKMTSDLRADIIDAIVAKVFTVLASAWNTTDTPSNYTDASSGGITATNLDDMIENILDRAPAVRAIVGTRKALFPIYEFSTSVPVVTVTGQSGTAIPTPQFDEFYRNNRITTYKGIPVVEIGQVYKNDLPSIREKMIPTDKVIVVGSNAGTIATMDGFETQDYTDMRTQPAEYIIHGWQAYAILIDMIDQIGVIKGST